MLQRFVVFILIWLLASSAHGAAAGMRGVPGGDAAAESPERPEPPRDIAFITFETLPANVEDNQWIGAGFSESLSAKIAAAEFPSLNVYERRMLAKTLRNSGVSQADVSGAFTGGDPAAVEKVTQAVRAAGVELIVIGSVQVAGPWNAPDTKFEFNGVVVDTATGRIEEGRAISFSGVIGKGGAELFTAHSDLAREVIAALDIDPASAKQPNKLGEPETDNIDAYRHYILGLAARDAGDLKKAIAYFEQASAISESFVKALKAKCDAYDEMYKNANGSEKVEVRDTWDKTTQDDLEILSSGHAAAIINRATFLVSVCEGEKQTNKCTEALEILDMLNDDAMNVGSSFKLENVTEFKHSGGAVFLMTDIIDENRDKIGSDLVALDVKTGKELWRERGVAQFELSGGAVLARKYVIDANGEPISSAIVALDEKTGKELWRFETRGEIVSFNLSGGAVFVEAYVLNANGDPIPSGLVALDEKTGKELWRYELEERGEIRSFKLSGGAVFIHTYLRDESGYEYIHSGIVALDEKTGKELWRFQTEGQSESFEISGGAVFVMTYIKDENEELISSGLTSIDVKTGKELWHFNTEHVIGSFELSSSAVFVMAYIGDENRDLIDLVALDVKTGKELWWEHGVLQFELSGGAVFVEAYIEDENEELISSGLTSLDVKTGEELWRFETEGEIISIVFSGGAVFAALMSGGIAIVNARTGTSTGKIIEDVIFTQFIVKETMLYAISGNKLFEYDLKTNTLEGVDETYGNIQELEVSDGMISALTDTNVFYVFSPSSSGVAVDNTAAMFLRAQAELLLGKPEKAKETLLALVALKPGMPGAWPLLFKTCEQTGNISCMTTAFINIHLRAPGIPEYSDVRATWLRQSPFSETGTFFRVPASTGPANSSSSVFLCKEDQNFYYDVNSGREPWFETGCGINSFELSGGTVFVNIYVEDRNNSGRSSITALDENTGNELWSFELENGINSFVLSRGAVLVSTYDDLAALDENTGEELWRFETEDAIAHEGVKYSGGAVFVTTYIHDENGEKLIGRGLVALDEKTGKELWRFDLEEESFFYLSGGAVFVCTNIYKENSNQITRSVLTALDENTGKKLWRFETESKIDAPELSDSVVFVHTYDGFVALDRRSGNVLWRLKPIYSFKHSGGVVFVDTYDGIVALDEKTGKELWRFEPGSMGYSLEHSAGGVVIVSTERYMAIRSGLVALDEKTGKELWRFEPESMGYSLEHSAGGVVIVSTYIYERYMAIRSGLVALDEKTGKELWQCNFDKLKIVDFTRVGDNLFIQISLPSVGSMVLVMDLNKAKQMVADGKKWW